MVTFAASVIEFHIYFWVCLKVSLAGLLTSWSTWLAFHEWTKSKSWL